tara:strand:- start:306 stop:512 length:207 start_codon:yes stop_codon:yes gene_type:complete
MADFKIKYIMFNGELHKLEEYTYCGYGGSTHTGSNLTKVPDDQIESIKKMLAAQGCPVPESVTVNNEV